MTKLKNNLLKLSVFLFGSIFLSSTAYAADDCELSRPIQLGGMNWESNLVLVEIQKQILEKGYGCQAEILPTETLTALAALQRGDLDVNTEIWQNMRDPWEKALKSGKVKRVNTLYTGGEGWFIPKYVAERFPDLKTASDLKKYKKEFEDPEEPNKGRFYGCPAGWTCEIVSENLFKALNLHDDFVLYQPGNGAAQKAAITSEYKRKKNIVFYYWYPTPLIGALDLVELDLGEFDKENHYCLTQKDCEDPVASSYPDSPIFTALNTDFMEQAPTLAKFFENTEIPIDEMNKALAHMDEEGERPEETAEWFLKEKPEIWAQWVSDEVAERVSKAFEN